ncbi:cell division and transport-associated protein TolA [Geothermobacter ehrlichii]|uniref:Cell division and transport-associated protein TolA n=2 Tax=Geothermobacter ehrlichii TaxID=213224 RepID=A0A5D3WHW8_9BACT|nr:cell division and transport-associated protein TolA [Geothermobacter ehrlichii]
MLGASLALHLVLLLLVGGHLLPRRHQPRPPAYVVDLVNLPVKAPQAGRPDGRAKKTVRKKSAPSAKKLSRPRPKPKPRPQPQPKKVVTRKKAGTKPAVKRTRPQAKAAATRPAAAKAPTRAEQERLERRLEMLRLKRQLAALAASDTRAGENAPLGEEKGRGSEQGVGYRLWLQQAYKEAWALSRYQVGRLDLEAEVEVVYDARGFLRDYSFRRKSGDRLFDDSIARAIRSVDRLEPPPGKTLRETIVFNLKDLMD